VTYLIPFAYAEIARRDRKAKKQMAITIWQPGRRLFSTAAILMILTAAAHTAGNLQSRTNGPAEQRLIDTMNGYRIPMGLGMNPSMSDINSLLVFTMSITFTALGLINLLLAGTPETSARLLRRVAWANALWVGAFLILSWIYRIPPPLISAAVIELFVLASLVALQRRDQR
jgi:hypothetical protein